MNMQGIPSILSLRDQARVVNSVLKERLDILLPKMMRECELDMWIIICNEDNYDPVFLNMTSFQCWAPILQMIVLYNPGDGRDVERLNISRTLTHGLMTDGLWNINSKESQWECLRKIITERNPKRIGINQSDVIWAADGLTASLKERLINTLGTEFSSRLESAEKLCVRWLETLLPQELDLYKQVTCVAHAIIKKIFSRNTITPGVTTLEDLRWAYWQIVADLGLKVSFPPFFRRMRSVKSKEYWGEDDLAVRPGDMLHCDVGIEYLRLCSDNQELAYILRPNENDVPQGLKNGMVQANRLQEIFMSQWQLGLRGNEILRRGLEKAHEAGIPKPRIYSHSLGHFLHEPGPLIGLPWEQKICPGRGDVVMDYNTCYTVELSSTCPVPEWGDQEVRFPIEQDAAFTEDGAIFIDGRQTEFHLI